MALFNPGVLSDALREEFCVPGLPEQAQNVANRGAHFATPSVTTDTECFGSSN